MYGKTRAKGWNERYAAGFELVCCFQVRGSVLAGYLAPVGAPIAGSRNYLRPVQAQVSDGVQPLQPILQEFSSFAGQTRLG